MYLFSLDHSCIPFEYINSFSPPPPCPTPCPTPLPHLHRGPGGRLQQPNAESGRHRQSQQRRGRLLGGDPREGLRPETPLCAGGAQITLVPRLHSPGFISFPVSIPQVLSRSQSPFPRFYLVPSLHSPGFISFPVSIPQVLSRSQSPFPRFYLVPSLHSPGFISFPVSIPQVFVVQSSFPDSTSLLQSTCNYM